MKRPEHLELLFPPNQQGLFAGQSLQKLSQEQRLSFSERLAQLLFRQPNRLLLTSFLALILSGALLLSLPISSAVGTWTSFRVSLFTATSATCVTGLVLVDTATTWSLFGRLVIISLIQCGALGLVTLLTALSLGSAKAFRLSTIRVAQDATGSENVASVRRLAAKILLITFSSEALGALALFLAFRRYFPNGRALAFAVFHAISAYCNAGFDLLGSVSGPFSSLSSFKDDPAILLPIMALISAGGLGFIVWLNILDRFRGRGTRLNFHTRLMLILTLSVTLVSGLAFFLLEAQSETCQDLGPNGRALNSFFHAVSLRTAGFNSLDQAQLQDSSKLLSCLLMFIGAGPCSTGGGVKLSTIAILWAGCLAELSRANGETVLLKHHLSESLLRRASSIVLLALSLILGSTFLLAIFEAGRFSLVDLLYETCSALGTVGVSAVGTPNLSVPSHYLLNLLMFLGRVGPMAFAISLIQAPKSERQTVYPEGKSYLG